jgi:DNA invertase Pin-like site-specific DNA recombinase
MRVGLYARVSTHDQQTLKLQLEAMRKYAKSRKWKIALEIKDVGSGASDRPKREELLRAARRRDIDGVIVWKLDRWGRSLPDLIGTLRELSEIGVTFVSLTEAIDLTTPSGRAMVGFLSVFAEFERELLKERVKAGLSYARSEGRIGGRPKTSSLKGLEIQKLFKKGLSKSEIARQLNLPRTSVRRALDI